MSDDITRRSSASLSPGEASIESGDSLFDGTRVVRVCDFEPASAMPADQLEAYKRRFGLLFADESTRRRGGIGSVVRVANALGEQFALKTLCIPQRDELVADEEHARLVEALKQSFRQEFECHKAVSGLKGFPRLYGAGVVDGVPAIVMEWVRGKTLAQVRDELSLDADGRISPLAAAQIGRDVFELLARMDFIEGGFVHRDISLGNVMLKTTRRTIQEQVEDGSFDVCLIDFGSSTPAVVQGSSFTSQVSFTRKATVDYAPPEMLTDDIEGVGALRMSPKVDVYAAASVVYCLASGKPPYDFSQGSRCDGADGSPYRVKSSQPAHRAAFAHGASDDIMGTLACEPVVGRAVHVAMAKLDGPADAEEVRDALMFVDEQLNDLLLPCLSADQAKRPSAEEMRRALAAFSGHYRENIECSLCGKPLIPCTLNGAPEGFAHEVLGARAIVRAACKLVSFAVWLAVVVATGVLAGGVQVSFAWGDAMWAGELSPLAVAAALAAPAVIGFACRAGSRATRVGLVRGSLGLLATAACCAVALAHATTIPAAAAQSLAAALFAAAAAGWCPMVADFALASPASAVRARTKAGLPPSADVPAGHAFEAGTVPALDTPSESEVGSVREDEPMQEVDGKDNAHGQ